MRPAAGAPDAPPIAVETTAGRATRCGGAAPTRPANRAIEILGTDRGGGQRCKARRFGLYIGLGQRFSGVGKRRRLPVIDRGHLDIDQRHQSGRLFVEQRDDVCVGGAGRRGNRLGLDKPVQVPDPTR